MVLSGSGYLIVVIWGEVKVEFHLCRRTSHFCGSEVEVEVEVEFHDHTAIKLDFSDDIFWIDLDTLCTLSNITTSLHSLDLFTCSNRSNGNFYL